ncbi:MAG: T9SS type A sorting domain-containing protein [Bacteroidota bacterium]|nr:T9SS type A sorting domain-containing protein [Bacteroidota bacterium]MDP3144897.1 T9SS type A sorting domain-containing protein [Bacteroidota bacterium]
MKPKTIYLKLALLAFLYSFNTTAQIYAPAVGQPGTSAMHKDSSAFINWVNYCSVIRGYQDISNSSLGYASAGDSSMVIGQAATNGVVSLGDGGYAICTFQFPIKNGPGNDFAVFENSFDDTFLELAFVEVSSDGVNFVRFASHSLTDTTSQTGTFGATDATKIHNLAGKYRGSYGTPFDLQELASNPNINANSITHVKIIDVIGSVNKQYAKRDSYNNIINDPWPTPFPSGGFDLDAIGVINQNTAIGLKENISEKNMSVYPNPANKGEQINFNSSLEIISATLYTIEGEKLLNTKNKYINTTSIPEGIYFLEITTTKNAITKKIIIR